MCVMFIVFLLLIFSARLRPGSAPMDDDSDNGW